MTGGGNRRLRATLVFTPAGDLETVFFMAGNEREEAILRQAVAPALLVLQWRRTSKRFLVWCFNHRLLPQRVAQWGFDLFRLRSD